LSALFKGALHSALANVQLLTALKFQIFTRPISSDTSLISLTLAFATGQQEFCHLLFSSVVTAEGR